jgi:hypothetical protein
MPESTGHHTPAGDTMTATAATPNLTPTILAALDAVATIRSDANADLFGAGHAYQQTGHVYGDAAQLHMTLLTVAYGTDAAAVYDVMLDSGEDHGYAAAYVAKGHADDADRANAENVACAECPEAAYVWDGPGHLVCECGHRASIMHDVFPFLEAGQRIITTDEGYAAVTRAADLATV